MNNNIDNEFKNIHNGNNHDNSCNNYSNIICTENNTLLHYCLCQNTN